MVRPPCCDEISSLKKGPWTSEEDQRLVDYINRQGHGSWRSLPRLAGLNRCGKSCRLRWINYLRPDIKRGRFSEEEERIIINLHSVLGNKWSKIASHLPGRTDNEIKNFWNTHIRKKFRQMGIDPITHQPRTDLSHLLSSSQILFPSPCGNLMMSPFWDNNALKLQTDATQLVKIQLLQNLLQVMNTSTIIPNTDPQSNHSGVLGFDPNLDPFPNVMTQTTMNPGSSHQATGEEEAHANSWTWFEAGLMDQLEGPDGNIQQESMLPPLIHASSDEISQIEKKSSGAHDHLATFEAWEKFMDDETSDSYWKTILDLTPLSSSSSIIW